MLKDASKSQKISIFAQTLTSFMENNIPQEWNKFYLKDVSFVNLMMRRIYNVLIVANPYDAFMLEDDGRIEEKIYNEYGDAVCMTYSVYGYNIYQDDEDITTAFFRQLLGQDGIECLSVDGEGNLVPKRGEAVGTGFFVSKDGKVVTNLHITQPWLSNPSSSDDPVGRIF